MPTSQAMAVWEGKLKDGKGNFKAGSSSFNGPYTFATRFEGKKGTNPEELIAAAHAACFSMALSAGLEKAGKPVTRVETTAACTLEMVDGAPDHQDGAQGAGAGAGPRSGGVPEGGRRGQARVPGIEGARGHPTDHARRKVG